MPTYWYARSATDATPSGPYYESKDDVEIDESAGERLRPIDESVLPEDADVVSVADDSDDADADWTDLSHEELKARAEAAGIAEETDLRSKQSIIDGLRNAE